MSSLGAHIGGGRGEKNPTSTILRRLKRKPKCGICVFHKNSKSSRSYCFHRKSVIRGSEKAHVGLGTSAAQSRLKTTEQQHGKTKMLQCMQQDLQAAMGQNRLVQHAPHPTGCQGQPAVGRGSRKGIQNVSPFGNYLPD